MDNPESRALMYYAFGLFYLLCIVVSVYALAYYAAH